MSEIQVKVLNDKKIEDIIYFVKRKDTIESVAQKFCVRKEELMQDNDLCGLEELQEGDILWIRKRNMAIHIVKPLETLDVIAQKYGVTIEHIKKLNDIDTIFIGQKLII